MLEGTVKVIAWALTMTLVYIAYLVYRINKLEARARLVQQWMGGYEDAVDKITHLLRVINIDTAITDRHIEFIEDALDIDSKDIDISEVVERVKKFGLHTKPKSNCHVMEYTSRADR